MTTHTHAHTHEEQSAGQTLEFGDGYRLHTGVEVVVLGLSELPPSPERESRQLVVRIRVRNASREQRDFDNDVGVVPPGADGGYTRIWTNPARYPDAIPGVVTLDPGQEIEGESHVLVPATVTVPVEQFRGAYLTMVSGCSSCSDTTMMVPRMIWTPPAQS